MVQVHKNIRVFPSPYLLAEKFAEELTGLINAAERESRYLTIALSGGSTPELLFSVLGDHFSNSAAWKHAHFFWGDERCVGPESGESNYGMAKRRLFDKIEIPASNIHRIKGEEEPLREAVRYSGEISRHVKMANGLPSFDILILGLGEDGHTASIFPGNPFLYEPGRICGVAVHPLTLQKRITLTLPVINNAVSIRFLATGARKAEIINEIVRQRDKASAYPASRVKPFSDDLIWYLDEGAAVLLNE